MRLLRVLDPFLGILWGLPKLKLDWMTAQINGTTRELMGDVGLTKRRGPLLWFFVKMLK